MTTDTKIQRKQVDIATPEDLLEALKSPNAVMRAATLRAIIANPEKAASLGTGSGFDLFQELLQLCEATHEDSMRAGHVKALLHLDDERSLEFAKQEFLATDTTDIILLTAKTLARLPADEREALLGPVVMGSPNQTKSRAAANLLAHCRDLPTRLALRVAILSDHPVEIAPLSDETLAAWLEELQGPYPFKTRKILLAKEDGSFSVLLAHWGKLPAPARLWAFQEAVREDPTPHVPLIRKVLQEGEERDEILRAALEAVPYLGRNVTDERMISPFYQHDDPAIRAAAIHAGQSVLDWTSRLEREPSDKGRAAIASRIGRCGRPEDASLLSSLLEDPNWRVRAAATNALVALAPASLTLLKNLLTHPKPVVQASAVQALNKLGKGEVVRAWLE